MPNVTMPDGTVVEMPDQIDAATGARLRKFYDAQHRSDAIEGKIPGQIPGMVRPAEPKPQVPVPSGSMGQDALSRAKYLEQYKSNLFEPVANAFGRANESLMGLGPMGLAVGGGEKGLEAAAMGAKAAYGVAAPKIASAVSKLGEYVPSMAPVTDRIKGFTSALRGDEALAARGAAQTGAQTALGDITKELGGKQAAKMGEAFSLEDVVTRTQRELDAAAQRGGRPTLDAQGATVRSAYSGAIDAAKKTRDLAAEKLYGAVDEAAAAKEATGARVNVKSATKDIQNLIDQADEIPTLKAKLNALLGSVEGGPKSTGPLPPVGTGARRYGVPKAKAEPTEGLTYKQLQLANRYIKDVAYSADVEGYGSVVRNAAKNLSKKLDTAMSEFVPEHNMATAQYRKLSEPLESLGTRFGKALTGSEGGLKGEAYTKVADQDLPARLFAKKDGIELMVDALAGGKNAPEKSRIAAQKAVDTMVENWIMEGARAGGATGSKAAKAIAAPQMEATLQAVPSVGKRVGEQLGREVAKETKISELGSEAKAARDEAEIAAKAKQKVLENISNADAELKNNNTDAAYKGYVAALRQATSGDRERFNAALQLIDRADTLQAKTDKARALAKKLATWTVGTGAASFVGYEAIKGK